MKKITLKGTLFLAASALALTSVVSCSDYTEFSESEIKQDLLDKKYDEAFIQRFGVPAEGHTWGMEDILEPIATGAKSTRGVDGNGAGQVNANRNQWIERESYPGGAYRDQPHVLAHDIQVPGWPNFDGRYYASSGPGALQRIFNSDYSLYEYYDGNSSAEFNGSQQPVGDITEYEIQYVSAWFRTHYIADPRQYREELHLSDFFIQNVSIDNDQKTYGSLSNPTAQTGTNGVNLVKASDKVSEQPINNQPENWRSNGNITRKSSADENLNYSLDQLCFKSIGGSETLGGYGWTHVYNFNNSNSNFNPEESSTNPNREIKYITSSGTEDFACRASMNSVGDAWVNNWVLVRLTWTEDGIAREGYYLAFDFKAETGETRIDYDGYYSNWIIKITPGHFNPSSDRVRRVMCEDLGGAFDFDFNDVVFDVAFDNSGEAIISVQAAGGTMPIMIDKDPILSANNPYEVHNLLGNVNGAMQPINVDENKNTHTVAIYRGGTHSITKPSDIALWVKNTKNGGSWVNYKQNWVNTYDTPYEHDRVGLDDQANNPYGTPSSTYDKTKNDAPRAFAIPLKAKIKIVGEEGDMSNEYETQWMKELKCIDNTYYWFSDWVQHPTNKYGLKGETGEKNREWWEQVVNVENLYFKSINADGSPSGSHVSPSAWVPVTKQPQENLKAFAHDMLALGAYDNAYGDAIWKSLDDGANQVTFTIVFKSTTLFDGTNGHNLEAILIPADIKTNTTDATKTDLYYNGYNFLTYTTADKTSFEAAAFDEEHPVIKSFQKAVLQEGYGKDENEKYTYTCRFTFKKEQLKSTSTSAANGYSEYLLLYVKTPNGEAVEIPVLTTVGGVTKHEWYVHY